MAYISVIPASQVQKDYEFEASLGKNVARAYLKNKIKTKGLWV
jgi:hypothetical protein